mmetsp:Transcript_82627/g.183496  ORF Transcript_82627/g.183496 Transcript_82627/m.183496 type:complete len:1087 (+) Transcript_82627:87-3347(+)
MSASPGSLPPITSPGRDTDRAVAFVFPRPTGWGKRGPPCSLRRLTLGIAFDKDKRQPSRLGSPRLRPGSGSSKKGSVFTDPKRPKPPKPDVTVAKDAELLKFAYDIGSRKNRQLLMSPSSKMGAKTLANSASASTLNTNVSGAKDLPGLASLLPEVTRIFRGELSACGSDKDVQMLLAVAQKVICAASSDSFGVSGRLAYRLREALRSLRNSSFAALGCKQRRLLQKLLQREAERRKAELVEEGQQDHGGALPPIKTTETVETPTPKHEESPSVHLPFMLRSRSKTHDDAYFDDEEAPRGLRGRAATDSYDGIEAPSFHHRPGSKRPSWYTQPERRHSTLSMNEGAPSVSSFQSHQSHQSHHSHKHSSPTSRSYSRNSIKSSETLVTQRAAPGAPEASPPPSSVAMDAILSAPMTVPLEEPEPAKKTPQVLEPWQKAFHKLKDDGQLHHDSVAQALELSGVPSPDEECIEKAFEVVCEGYSTLSEDQFSEFIFIFHQKQREAYKLAFQQCDADGSGSVEAGELKSLLAQCGIEPMAHVLSEVLSEVDEDGSGVLNFEEFEKLMDIIRCREGFARSEYEAFVSLFQKFDNDRSGEIDTNELQNILVWLGFAFDKERTKAIIQEVDANRSGTVSMREFLLCMRKVQEAEIKAIKDVIEKTDVDGDGNISREEMPAALKALGYLPEMDAVWEAALDAGIDANDNDIDLGEFWRLLSVYRKREGFIFMEMSDIAEGFNHYDRAGTGEIQGAQVGKVLRWLGYNITYEVQMQLVASVDIDGSGSLSVLELQKLVRMLQGRDLDEIKNAFSSAADAETGCANMRAAMKGFISLGCGNDKGVLPPVRRRDLHKDAKWAPWSEDAPEDDRTPFLSREGFMRTAVHFKRLARKAFRENGGFSSEQVAELKARFQKFDTDSSGDIGRKELVTLIEDIFPHMAHDPAVRPQLAAMIKEVDMDGSGTLDLRDFIRLMDGLRELEQQDKRDKEMKAVANSGFSPREVAEFRDLFLHSGKADHLAIRDLRAMIKSICPLGDKNMAELNEHIKYVAGASLPADAIHGSAEVSDLDFPDFLLLMKRLMDTNFAGINKTLSPS